MIDFPASPTVGQQFTAAGVTWTWDGVKWGLTAAAGAPITIGDAPPSNPVIGALWYDSIGGQLYVWYNDGNSSQWVPATNANPSLPHASTTVLGGVKVDGTTIKAAADGTISAPIFMGDNRIINGDMRIDQRNNGASGTATNVYTVDRWQYAASLAGKFNWGQNWGGGGGPPGFPYTLVFSSASAYSPLAADYFVFLQTIEADMVSDFAWGTGNAQPVTLSFWASSSLTGTFGGAIRNAANNRTYPFIYSLPNAGVMTEIAITIPGDTAGTWLNKGNAAWGQVIFDLGSGATNRMTANAWTAGSFLGAMGTVSVVSTNTAYLIVTGVKLEIGSVATPYNRQSLAKSMADCERYYQTGTITQTFYAGAGQAVYGTINAPTTMRAAPTMVAQATGSASNVTAQQIGAFAPPAIYYQANVAAAGLGIIGLSYTASAEL